MGKVIGFLMAVSLVIFNASCSKGPVGGIDATKDNFYKGLARVVERNLKDFNKCLDEVDNYYQRNQATAKEIRELARKDLADAMAAAAEIESAGGGGGETEGPFPRGLARYVKALKTLAAKNAQQAMEVAARAMELMSISIAL